MKKVVFLLCLVCIFLSSCGVYPSISLDSKFDVVIGEDKKLEGYSDLSFKNINYNGVNIPVLVYLTDTLELFEEEGRVQSFIAGKTCISIMGSVLNVNKTVTNTIASHLIQELNGAMGEYEIVGKQLDTDMPYIISKNDMSVFIDFITSISSNKKYVVYYRIIIQDVSQLGTEMTEEEYLSLPDVLNELLEVLDIEEKIEIPKKEILFKKV